MMRITRGSREIYPTGGKLAKGSEEMIILTIKLRLYGGARDTQSQEQTTNTRSGRVQEVIEGDEMEDMSEVIDN